MGFQGNMRKTLRLIQLREKLIWSMTLQIVSLTLVKWTRNLCLQLHGRWCVMKKMWTYQRKIRRREWEQAKRKKTQHKLGCLRRTRKADLVKLQGPHYKKTASFLRTISSEIRRNKLFPTKSPTKIVVGYNLSEIKI